MRISDWSSDVCSSDLIEEVLNPVARQNEADVAHDFAGGIVDADGVDLGEDHADDVAAAVQQRTAAVALADVSSHDDGGAAGRVAFATQNIYRREHQRDRHHALLGIARE